MIVKNYIDYIKDARIRHEKWRQLQKNEWWKLECGRGKMDIKGDYLETVNFKSNDRRNDASLFTNHTNVNNSDWSILFYALGQHLIDWCISHKKNVYICLVKIHRNPCEIADTYGIDVSVKVRNTSEHGWKDFDDPEFELYGAEVCDMLDMFATVHKDDLPLDWNYFAFSLDCLDDSCECGEWCYSSDGCMCLANVHDNEYDEYVYCM